MFVNKFMRDFYVNVIIYKKELFNPVDPLTTLAPSLINARVSRTYF